MKKNITIVVLLLSLFLLVGCNKDNKKSESVIPHSYKELKEIAKKDENISVFEIDTDDPDIQQSIVKNNNGGSYKYYTFKSDEDAKNFYDYYLTIYKSKKSDSDTENIKNDVSYELVTTDKYYYIRVDKNAMVAVECKIEDKDAIIDSLKTIKYYE